MLAIFEKSLANPPQELNSPASLKGSKKPKFPEETLKEFLSLHPNNGFSMNFGDVATLAYLRQDLHHSLHQRYSIIFSFLLLFFLKNIIALDICRPFKHFLAV